MALMALGKTRLPTRSTGGRQGPSLGWGLPTDPLEEGGSPTQDAGPGMGGQGGRKAPE